MNYKNLFSILLCVTTVFSESNLKGECRELEEKLEKNKTDEFSISLSNCILDDKEKAVEYEINIDCNVESFSLTQTFVNNLSTFTNLKKLSLYECYSKDDVKVDLEPLKKLEKVTELSLARTTHFYLIDYFKNLKIVRIDDGHGPEKITNNSIEEITITEVSNYDSIEVNFEKLSNLKKLDISSTHCDSGDIDIHFPKNIKYLSLYLFRPSENLINRIIALEKLESLNLHFDYFEKEIHDLTPLKKLTNLIELGLSCELFSEITIPDSLFSLINLKALKIGFVENIKVFENVDKLKNLETLLLTESGLTSIDKIVNLKKLKYLNVSSNKITTLNEKIGDLKNLEHLDIGDNDIKTLPETMSNLTNLEYLDISSTGISEIPEFLNKFPKLEYIDFSYNNNLKGKILTNDSLKWCYYTGINEGNICKTKEVECLRDEIKPCTNDPDKISTNGKCGSEDGYCPTGKCCSKYGYCGTTDKHCGTGCQSEFGKCNSTTDVKVSTNDKCGSEDGRCPDNKCCSKYGYCGTTDKHCGTGCQSEFGKCNSTTNVKISTNDKCGPEDGRCPDSKCCSKYGYCGTSEKHCGTGCQSEFGKCFDVKISSNGKCGPEDGKCPDNKCCSVYGYCGTSDRHCKSGCQSKYGKCL